MRSYVLHVGVAAAAYVGRNCRMDLRGAGVLDDMLLIPSLIFVAVIELASRIRQWRAPA
jgi:hypothetical protein